MREAFMTNFSYNTSHLHARIQRAGGGGAVDTDPGKLKSTYVPQPLLLVRIPWKITKLPSQHSMLGHHWPASETPLAFRWRADDGPLFVVFGPLSISSIKKEKKVVKAELDAMGSVHDLDLVFNQCRSSFHEPPILLS